MSFGIDYTNEMNKPLKSIGSECTCTIEMYCFKDVNLIGNACTVGQLISCIFRRLTQLFKDPTP